MTILKLLASFSLILFTLTLLYPGALTLMVIDQGTGKTYTYVVYVGDKVVLRYTHSVYKQDVIETFEVSSTGALILREVVFKGGKTPSMVQSKDLEDYYTVGGPFIVGNLSLTVESINLKVGSIGRPVIVVGGNELDLHTTMGLGASVKVVVEPSVWSSLAKSYNPAYLP